MVAQGQGLAQDMGNSGGEGADFSLEVVRGVVEVFPRIMSASGVEGVPDAFSSCVHSRPSNSRLAITFILISSAATCKLEMTPKRRSFQRQPRAHS